MQPAPNCQRLGHSHARGQGRAVGAAKQDGSPQQAPEPFGNQHIAPHPTRVERRKESLNWQRVGLSFSASGCDPHPLSVSMTACLVKPGGLPVHSRQQSLWIEDGYCMLLRCPSTAYPAWQVQWPSCLCRQSAGRLWVSATILGLGRDREHELAGECCEDTPAVVLL